MFLYRVCRKPHLQTMQKASFAEIMKLIELNIHKGTESNETLLFVLASEHIFLLKNHYAHIGKHLRALGHQDHDKKVFDIDPKNQDDRNFFQKLRSELIELSHYMESIHNVDFMEGAGRYDSLFYEQDQNALQQFVEWCDMNCRRLTKYLCENDFFE